MRKRFIEKRRKILQCCQQNGENLHERNADTKIKIKPIKNRIQKSFRILVSIVQRSA